MARPCAHLKCTRDATVPIQYKIGEHRITIALCEAHAYYQTPPPKTTPPQPGTRRTKIDRYVDHLKKKGGSK